MITLKKIAKAILRYEARLVLRKYKPKIIAITGSVGKTSAREAMYLALSKKFFIRKNEKSFTSDVGVPLAIIGCPYGTGSPWQFIKNIFLGLKLLVLQHDYPVWLILEIDGDKPGDIKNVSQYLSPDILIVTAIGEVPAHIESFYSVEDFLREKGHIIQAVKRTGLIIYNADDKVTRDILEDVPHKKISCGITNESDIKGSDFKILYGGGKSSHIPTGMSFEISHNTLKYPVAILGSIGIHNEYAALISFAVCTEFGVKPNEVVSSLHKFTALPGRMNIIAGLRDSVIIDDTYNSSPIALEQALLVMNKLKSSGKKIAVIGDMLELGRYSAVEHKKAAETVFKVASHVICVGIRARKIKDELILLGMEKEKIVSVSSGEEAGGELQEMLEAGDIALIKGSQATRLEKVVEQVMRHPEDRKKLLVRQEKEWLTR